LQDLILWISPEDRSSFELELRLLVEHSDQLDKFKHEKLKQLLAKGAIDEVSLDQALEMEDDRDLNSSSDQPKTLKKPKKPALRIIPTLVQPFHLQLKSNFFVEMNKPRMIVAKPLPCFDFPPID
jgi:hypothetical protein